MAPTPEKLTVYPQVGMSITVKQAGSDVTSYETSAGSDAHAYPKAITTATNFFFAAAGRYQVHATVNDVDLDVRDVYVPSPLNIRLTADEVAKVATSTSGDLTAVDVTATGQTTLDNADIGGVLGFGAAEAVTIASGVATVTKSFVVLDAEGAGTTDQLDTITLAGAAAGDLLLLTVTATDTITVDDANINLAAATRAIAPGGSLLLFFDGTEWTELHFTAATDNT